MADRGQSSDPALPRYDAGGITLVDGYVELVQIGDPLAGPGNRNVNKIKIKAWRGPNFIQNPAVDVAGVDWILAENWWPYQRPTFVTPPFAGYISGHSTFSRAAAVIMTQLTGDAFFPGGMGEFVANQNEFLVFEEGPSVNVVLQWATYEDASDQTSLSRIWGGIHPPIDDIPGRRIGARIGNDVFAMAERYFHGETPSATTAPLAIQLTQNRPNPFNPATSIRYSVTQQTDVTLDVYSATGRLVRRLVERQVTPGTRVATWDGTNHDGVPMPSGIYFCQLRGGSEVQTRKMTLLK
jgi:hypothetical protein